MYTYLHLNKMHNIHMMTKFQREHWDQHDSGVFVPKKIMFRGCSRAIEHVSDAEI